jgi:hypothetical protein
MLVSSEAETISRLWTVGPSASLVPVEWGYSKNTLVNVFRSMKAAGICVEMRAWCLIYSGLLVHHKDTSVNPLGILAKAFEVIPRERGILKVSNPRGKAAILKLLTPVAFLRDKYFKEDGSRGIFTSLNSPVQVRAVNWGISALKYAKLCISKMRRLFGSDLTPEKYILGIDNLSNPGGKSPMSVSSK